MQKISLNTDNFQEVITQALAVLRDGGLIIYPTETCYGIGADATNQEAINKLLAYKTKREDKALSVAVADTAMAEDYVEINPTAKEVYANFLPGPVTVISKGKGKLADHVESSNGTQGIRIPDHKLIQELVKQFGKPITSTSANASYKKTPYCLQDIIDNTTQAQQDAIGLFIDAGVLPKRKPSTVIDTTLDNIHIVRSGSLELTDPKTMRVENEAGTVAFAQELFAELKEHLGEKAIVFLLEGDLGAGKTFFSKQFAKLVGVEDVVVSPTYTICREYKGQVDGTAIPFRHIDTYRLFDAEEMDDLRPAKLFAAPSVVLIEWANKVAQYIQQYLEKALVIKMRITQTGETSRKIQYTITKIEY